jgi:hypothetical protein
MPEKTKHPRILSLDIRLERFGYAVFEGPKRLLDWGVCLYGLSSTPDAARKKIVSLLKMFIPSIVVVTMVPIENTLEEYGVHRIFTSLKAEMDVHSIPIEILRRPKVRQMFRSLHATTKYEVASLIAKLYPELTWKLPPKRKVWQKEHYRMAMFEAVAGGYAYWQLLDTES